MFVVGVTFDAFNIKGFFSVLQRVQYYFVWTSNSQVGQCVEQN